MDGMALLCTLHARGPATLQRLRSAGLRELEDLSRLHSEELARIVDLSPAAARRLAREAALLARRLGAQSLPRTVPAPAPVPVSAPAFRPAAEGAEPQVELRPTQRPEPALHAVRASLPPHARPERSMPHGPEPYPAHPAAAPGAAGSDASLRAGSLPGLSPEICGALARVGIHSAGELARAADLTLARRIGLSYPKLLELAHEARACLPGQVRSVSARAPSAPVPQGVYVGPPSPEEVGAGGPFT